MSTATVTTRPTGKKTGNLPSKTSINLAMREKSKINPLYLIPLLVVLIAAAFLFGKFAVADRLAAVDRTREALAATQQKIAALEQSTAGFDDLNSEYGRYSIGWMTDREKALTDRIQVLDLLETVLMEAGPVENFTLTDNVCSAQVAGLTLDDVSRLVERLYGQPLVDTVSVHTVSNEETPVVSLLITLAQPEEGGGEG